MEMVQWVLDAAKRLSGKSDEQRSVGHLVLSREGWF
jgi:hypothetical protein